MHSRAWFRAAATGTAAVVLMGSCVFTQFVVHAADRRSAFDGKLRPGDCPAVSAIVSSSRLQVTRISNLVGMKACASTVPLVTPAIYVQERVLVGDPIANVRRFEFVHRPRIMGTGRRGSPTRSERPVVQPTFVAGIRG